MMALRMVEHGDRPYEANRAATPADQTEQSERLDYLTAERLLQRWQYEVCVRVVSDAALRRRWRQGKADAWREPTLPHKLIAVSGRSHAGGRLGPITIFLARSMTVDAADRELLGQAVLELALFVYGVHGEPYRAAAGVAYAVEWGRSWSLRTAFHWIPAWPVSREASAPAAEV